MGRGFPEGGMFKRGEKCFLADKSRCRGLEATKGKMLALGLVRCTRPKGIFIPSGEAPRFLGWKGSILPAVEVWRLRVSLGRGGVSSGDTNPGLRHPEILWVTTALWEPAPHLIPPPSGSFAPIFLPQMYSVCCQPFRPYSQGLEVDVLIGTSPRQFL